MPKAVNGWKVCSKCGERKPVSEFYKSSRTADSLQCWCKSCHRAAQGQNRQRLKDEGPTIIRTTKVCPKCGEEKPVSEFNKSTSRVDGLTSWCKACVGISGRQSRRRRKDNGPTIIRTTKVCPTCSEEKPVSEFYKRRSTVDGLTHQCKACQKLYWQSAAGKVVQQAAGKVYRQTEGGKATGTRARHKRRALEAEVVSDLTTEDYALLDARHPVCNYCEHEFELEGPFKRTLEHLVPLSRGGQDTFDNLVFACARCNFEKHDKLPEEWDDRWYEREDGDADR